MTFYGSGSDGLIKLAPIAAVTTKLELQTCVYLLALRHPTPVALQAAMIDQMSHGRLILGVGIGGEDPNEWWACGVDPKTRARRTDESLQILRSLWTQEETTFDGKYFKLDRVRMRPKPFAGRRDAAGRRPLRRRAAPHRALRRRLDGHLGVGAALHRGRRENRRVRGGSRPRRPRVPARHAVLDGRRRDRRRARAKVAGKHAGVLSLPFETFEKYTPYGTPAEVAEFIAPYVEAGCRRVNFVVADAPEAVLERSLAVRDALRTICG